MNINHFAYFVEAVRENSITKAAELLFISQSTISKAIKCLEQAYNTELIDRKARNFKLTSAGEIFYNSAVKIVSNYQSETTILATLLHSHRGKLTLGIPPVTITIIHSLLYQYEQMYPEIDLRVIEIGAQTAFSLAQSGAADISIIIEPFDNPEFNKVPIMESEAVCVVSPHHRLANYDTISFSQLKNEKFLVFDKSFMLYYRIIDCCKEAGFMPNISLESAQWDLLVEAVSDGEGITILPRPIIQKFCPQKVKMLHLCNPSLPWIPVAAYHKEKFLSTPMKLFLDLIQATKLHA
ncbi:LysR family transcriptional regulator [Megasphaera sp.]|uniref:LysR family transcriptional regulator n=1 Tax=Megasphaera sp. TaxID=2023260 RepID=UPI00352242C9